MIVPVKVEANLGNGLTINYCTGFDIEFAQSKEFDDPYVKVARKARELAKDKFVEKIKSREPGYVLLDKLAGKELMIELKVNGETWIYCEKM